MRVRTKDLLANSFNVFVFALVVAYALTRPDRRVALVDASGVAVRDLLWFAVLCGLASFATIETLKRVFGLRGIFHRTQAEEWVRRRAGRSREDDIADDATYSLAWDDLIRAMSLHGKDRADDLRRVFNLPTEQLAAQISAAADAALAEGNPRPLLQALSGMSWKELDRSLRTDDRNQARGGIELAQRVRTGIDQLQISLAERWRRYVQGAALWIAGVYGIVLIHNAHVRGEARYVLAALLVGGLFAWVARDLTAAINRSRR